MQITLFTSNQPRHISFAGKLAKIADQIFCVQECNTIFPGVVEDFFEKSEIMQHYFRSVFSAERKIFGDVRFSETKLRTLSIKMGDLAYMKPEGVLKDALKSDLYIIFGSSFIKGWLADFLVENNALNIHMGISPYYRGSSCNFWALYDNNPGYVGGTIHKLSKYLDGGDILFHCVPDHNAFDNPFMFSMSSVEIVQDAFLNLLETGKLFNIKPMKQDRDLEIRYTKKIEFNDLVAAEFMARDIVIKDMTFQYPKLINPYFGSQR